MPRPKTPPAWAWGQLARAIALTAVLFAVIVAANLSLVNAAWAQSTVRPPADATTNILPPGPDMQGGVLGNRSIGERWHDVRKGAVGSSSPPTLHGSPAHASAASS